MPPSTPSILLVSCYELGHLPLGLAVPAGVLRRAGIEPVLVDTAVESLDEKKLATASIIGISVPMHTALRLGLRVAARAREVNPGAHICFYGLYAGLNRDYLLSHGADSCLGAEFEADLLALARAVLGATDPDPPRGRRALDLTPDRRGIRRHRGYARLDDGSSERTIGTTAATRGCKHTCRHCPLTPVYRGRFTAVPVDAVMADIAGLVDDGASHVSFADPDFLNGPTHALRVARRLHAEHPGVTFDYTARIEHLARHRTVVEELFALGNLFVVSALESLNDDVLAALEKGHTRADALDVIRRFRAMGLTLRPSLVPFTPWESLASYVDLVDTLCAEGLVGQVDPVQLSIRLLVPPGSALVGSPAMRPHLGALDEANFTHCWSHPDPRMDALQREVSAIVAQAADGGADPAAAFDTVRRAACRTAQRPEPEGVTTPPARRAPRLTEAWFC